MRLAPPILFGLHELKALLFPPNCSFCLAPIEDYNSLCPRCWLSIRFINRGLCKGCGEPIQGKTLQKYPPNINTAYCPYCQRLKPSHTNDGFSASVMYDEFIRPFIVQMKNHNGTALALLFAKFFHVEDFAGADYIVPVPIHPLRLYQRTYNQAALLAYALRHWHGAEIPPVVPELLEKQRYTPKQKGRSQAERMANVDGSFSVPAKHRATMKGKVIVVLDDVLASGATLRACQRALMEAGAKEVRGVALAKTVPDKPACLDTITPAIG